METIQRLTDGIGVDRFVEADGLDAERATSGPTAEEGQQMSGRHEAEIDPETNPQGDNWHPGGAGRRQGGDHRRLPAGDGVPIGLIQQRNLTVKGGNRKHIPKLVGLVATGALDPTKVLT